MTTHVQCYLEKIKKKLYTTLNKKKPAKSRLKEESDIKINIRFSGGSEIIKTS